MKQFKIEGDVDLKKQIRHLEAQLRASILHLEAERRKKLVLPKLIKITKGRGARDFIRVALGDLHGSKMDKASVATVLADIKALQPKEIILGGDIIDAGGFLAQHFVMGYVAETEYSYEDDIVAANNFLDQLQNAAPSATILYIEGNHEHRLEKWIVTQTLRHRKDSDLLRRLLAPDKMLNLALRKIQYFPQGEIHGNCRQRGFIRRGKCYFVHSVSSSANAAADALQKVAGNVVFWHTHRADTRIVRRESAGTIGAWNPGCLCELTPMWQHTLPNNWTHGYAVQMVSSSGNFLHVNVPIIEGQSLLIPLTSHQ